MANDKFYERFFNKFWEDMDRSSFVEDENSMFGEPDSFEFLIEKLRPKEIIEIGSWKGHSANFMADVCRKLNLKTRILCVDTFLGGPEHWLMPGALESLHRKNGFPTVYDRFLGNVAARGNTDMIFPFPISSGAAAQILRYLEFKADLIFVDAGHSYEDVCADIMNYYPVLSESGVMFGDDYQFEPLANAVHDCAAKLGTTVAVTDRKWTFVNPALVSRLMLERTQLRTSYEGWIHP